MLVCGEGQGGREGSGGGVRSCSHGCTGKISRGDKRED